MTSEHLKTAAIRYVKNNVLDFVYGGKKYHVYPTRTTVKSPWKIISFRLACFDDYGTAGPLPNAEPAFSEEITCAQNVNFEG